jgi:hypothetical protein
MPQHQKTKPIDLSDLGLPALNEQEEKLVELAISGLDQAECYLRAYDATGYSHNSLKVRACKKFAEPKIRAHIRALRAAGATNGVVTVEARIKEEFAFAQRAEDAGNFGAAGGAYDRINKLAGMYVEKIQDVTVQNDTMTTIKQIADEFGPDIARAIAKTNGIEYEAPEGSVKH